MTDISLQDKVIIVTGASMGVGRAVALRCAQLGAVLVVNSSGAGGVDPAPLQSLVAQIERDGGEAIYSVGSVADPEYAQQLIATCVDRFGRLDGLANVAGVSEGGANTIREMDAQNWKRITGVHLDGSFYTSKYAIEQMVEQGGGTIVNTGSHAFLGSYGGSAYAAAKGAILSLSAAIAKDMWDDGIRCNVVLPGARTRLSTGAAYEAQIRDLNRRGLLDDARMYSALNPAPPEVMAAMYSYLLSDAAAAISGRLFSASGLHVGEFSWPVETVLETRDLASGGVWEERQIAALLDPS